MSQNEEKGVGHEKSIEVFINGASKKIPDKKYTLAELKAVLDVPAEDELAVIKDKGPVPVQGDNISVHKGEKFISHKRRGASA